MDQDHGSQPLEEGEGFVQLRTERLRVSLEPNGKRRIHRDCTCVPTWSLLASAHLARLFHHMDTTR